MPRRFLSFCLGVLACGAAAADILDGRLLVNAASQRLRVVLGPEVQVRPLGSLRDIEVPPGAPLLEAKVDPAFAGQRRVRVDVHVRVDAHELDVPVWFEVRQNTRANVPKPRAWVLRQQPVTVEVRVADVVVESRGLALADGREGDLVQVRLSAGGFRQARVVAPGRVAI